MIGKPLMIIQVPDKRKFSIDEAARYLGIHKQTLREKSDLGEIPAKKEGKFRVFLLEDLDRYLNNLPPFEQGEFSGTRYSDMEKRPDLRVVRA